MKRLFYLIALLTLFRVNGFCDGYFGRVTKVWAGDRIDIKHNGSPEHIRVYGVECPVGAYGSTAREFTRQLAEARSVHITTLAKDEHGNIVAHVYFVGGHSLSDELVRSGMARWSPLYAPHDRELARLEAEARADRRGCWADSAKAFPTAHAKRRSQRPSVKSDNQLVMR